MSKRATPTCAECYFHRAGLCALQVEAICPTFRVEAVGQRLTPPPQPRLVPRTLAHAAA